MDFEDIVAWLARRVDKTTVARLLRCSWERVARIVTRVVASHVDEEQMEAPHRCGRRLVPQGPPLLDLVADHDREGRVIWAGEGRSAATLERFFDLLGDERTARLEAISCDMGGGYLKAIKRRAAHADGRNVQ